MSPRQLRSELTAYSYFHICSRGNNGQEIFLSDQDRIRYLSFLEKYRTTNHLKCCAYCLMTNHTHLLLHSSSVQALSRTMHLLNSAYAVYFNRRYKRKGHLFQGRFSSWVIEDEAHLIATKEYIENNPVKGGLATKKEDYCWSSASIEKSPLSLSLYLGSDPGV